MRRQPRRGGRPGILTAVDRMFEDSGGPYRPSRDTTKCPSCGGSLEVYLGAFGATMERCRTRTCDRSQPQRARPGPEVDLTQSPRSERSIRASVLPKKTTRRRVRT